ncbi:MAG: hypothetical protein MEQ84_13280 [Mesorhizobium sp.]|nr:hypothetical protein [Mesorhizobium sp.]
MQALRAVYNESRSGREAAERLAPLLSLLESPEPGERSPLADLTDLLTTVVRTQVETLRAIEALADRIEELR